MDIALTKMSSKGQVVIPAEMRENIEEGDKLLIIKSDEQLILKKASDLNKNLKEDIEFARRTEEALNRIEKGKGVKMDFDDFIKEMKKWQKNMKINSVTRSSTFIKQTKHLDQFLLEKLKKQITKVIDFFGGQEDLKAKIKQLIYPILQ